MTGTKNLLNKKINGLFKNIFHTIFFKNQFKSIFQFRLFLTILYLVTILGQAITATAQNNNGWNLYTGIATGNIVKNYPSFPDYGLSLFAVTELMKQTDGSKDWHKPYFFPQTGIRIIYGNTGNNKIFGHTLALMPQLSLCLAQGTNYKLLLKLSSGLAWFSKPFHYQSNPANTLIGSSLTNISCANLCGMYSLTDSWSLSGGASIYHFSNAHTQLPNVGMNIPIAEVGIIRHFYYGSPVPKKAPDTVKTRITWQKNIRIICGWHEMGETTTPTNGIKYPVYGLGFGLNRNHSDIHRWYAGIEYNYYTSFRDYITHQELYKNVLLNSSTGLIYIGHEFVLGHIGLDTQCGLYLWNPLITDRYSKSDFLKTISSNKLGINYYFSELMSARYNAYLGIHIKANFGQADYLSFTCGILF